jgi:hypothetical protein
MAASSNGVVVTDEMLTEAIRAGDLRKLTIWAGQGVRVTTARPLCVAARSGILELVRLLVLELGANVNQRDQQGLTPLMLATKRNNLTLVQCLVVELGADVNLAMANGGWTPLTIAARRGNLAVVRCLIEFGAEVGAMDTDGTTSLLESARDGQYGTVQYLLEIAVANIDYANNFGNNVWEMMRRHLDLSEYAVDDRGEEDDPVALTALLRVMVLRGAPPPALVALLSPEPARVVQEGARLRARLPAYLAYRCA